LNQLDGLGEQLLTSSSLTSNIFAHQLPDSYQNCFRHQFGQKGWDTKIHQLGFIFKFGSVNERKLVMFRDTIKIWHDKSPTPPPVWQGLLFRLGQISWIELNCLIFWLSFLIYTKNTNKELRKVGQCTTIGLIKLETLFLFWRSNRQFWISC